MPSAVRAALRLDGGRPRPVPITAPLAELGLGTSRRPFLLAPLLLPGPPSSSFSAAPPLPVLTCSARPSLSTRADGSMQVLVCGFLCPSAGHSLSRMGEGEQGTGRGGNDLVLGGRGWAKKVPTSPADPIFPQCVTAPPTSPTDSTFPQ